MLFEDALRAMRVGKKIRKTSWTPKQFLQIKDYCVRDAFGDRYDINDIHFPYGNWDIVEEPRKRCARMYINKGNGELGSTWRYVEEAEHEPVSLHWIGDWVEIPDEIPR